MKQLIQLTLLIFSVAGLAQKPFIIGQTIEIESKILQEKRTLNIYLPDGYDKSQTAYPVIYLLDGSANEDFIHIAGLTQFLTMIEKMPASIVVGIANVDRRRDFTFPTTVKKDKEDFPTTGGSQKFMDFMAIELQPYIDSHFRCNASKTLIGQSLGGLLATEILLKNPSLFNQYLIVSPSLWWDNESLLEKLAQKPDLVDNGVKIYISVGNEGKVMQADAEKLHQLLQNASKDKSQLFFNPMLEENHATILHNSAYQGLEKLNQSKSKS